MPAESFTIDVSLPKQYRRDLLRQFQQYYLLPYEQRFRNIQQSSEGDRQTLTFTANGPEQAWRIDVSITLDEGVAIELRPAEGTPPEEVQSMRQEMVSVIRTIEQSIRSSTLYFGWAKGEEIVPERRPTLGRRVIERIISSTFILLYVLLLAFNIVLFVFFGLWAVLAVLGLQLLIVLFADRIYLRMGKWRITAEHPDIYMLQYLLTGEELGGFQARSTRKKLLLAKDEIFQQTFAVGKQPSCDLISGILLRYGVMCSPERISSKTVNVYAIVRRAAEMYGIPVPKIVVSNSLLPNAAATGPGPGHGVVLITAGLLVQLNEEEILSVVGHELGHLKGRDPLLLFGLFSAEFLLRATVLLPLFLLSPFLYLVVALGVVFFIAKFLEARADLLSAVVIGQPKIMAESLGKIGFQRLGYERTPGHRLSSWLRFDPHPPLYFRIERLSKMTAPVRVEHPLLQSAKDVLRGFRSALHMNPR